MTRTRGMLVVIGLIGCASFAAAALAQESPPATGATASPAPSPPPAADEGNLPPVNPQAGGPQTPEEPPPPPPPPLVLPPPPDIESTAPALAPPPKLPPQAPPEWNGDLSLGYVKSSGNANSSTLNAKFDLQYKFKPWDNLLNGSAFRAASDGVNTDEKYSLGDKLLYNLGVDDYLFGRLNIDEDRFGVIATRFSGAGGYGRHLLHTPTQTLDVDAGLGANRTREQGAGDFNTDLIGVFSAAYIWKIAAGSQFKQTLRAEVGASNTFVNPISELRLTIIRNFFATLGYEVRYNSATPANTYHTDTITTVNIGYAFGKPLTGAP